MGAGCLGVLCGVGATPQGGSTLHPDPQACPGTGTSLRNLPRVTRWPMAISPCSHEPHLPGRSKFLNVSMRVLHTQATGATGPAFEPSLGCWPAA